MFSDPFIWHDDGATAGNDGGGGMMSSKGMAGTGPNRSDRAAEPMVPLPLARAFFERAKLPSAVLSAVLSAVIGAVRSGSREGTDRKEKREKESKMEKAHHTDAKVEEEQMGLGRGAWFLACKLIGLAQQQMQQQMQQQPMQQWPPLEHNTWPEEAHIQQKETSSWPLPEHQQQQQQQPAHQGHPWLEVEHQKTQQWAELKWKS